MAKILCIDHSLLGSHLHFRIPSAVFVKIMQFPEEERGGAEEGGLVGGRRRGGEGQTRTAKDRGK